MARSPAVSSRSTAAPMASGSRTSGCSPADDPRRRDRLDSNRKVTAIRVFDRGAAVECRAISARQIGQLWGLGDIQIGDVIGTPPKLSYQRQHFAPPTLETVVAPRRIADKGALRVALGSARRARPADQRPPRRHPPGDLCLALRRGPEGSDPSNVGERLRPRRQLPARRPRSTSNARSAPASLSRSSESETHPFSATIGLRIEPPLRGSGVQFRLDVDPRHLPMLVYKTGTGSSSP